VENQNKQRPFLSKWIKPSTREFYREGKKLENSSWFTRLHGYIYGRWTYLYIGIATGEHRLTRIIIPLWNLFMKIFRVHGHGAHRGKGASFADMYHGKIVPLDEARRLVSVRQDIDIRNLDKIIPYTRARDIVLRNPDHIVVLDCPCRVARPNPCLPLDVCIAIGEPFAQFVLDHHPRRSRRITQAEAITILEEEHARGHVHHAFFKDAVLDRFYAICNCCSCCCGAMQAYRGGTPMLASSGFVARVDSLKCSGCGLCVEACPFGAIRLDGQTIAIDEKVCLGCGVCIDKCNRKALALERDFTKSEPLLIRELMEQSRASAATLT